MFALQRLAGLAAIFTLALLVASVTNGCGGGGGHGGGGGGGGGSAAQLVVYLDPNLDGNGGAVKATTITSADLLDAAGSRLQSAVITASPNLAVFSLKGLTASTDYFLRINGLADDLVPARVVAINEQTVENVGTKLQHAIEQVNTQPPITSRDFDIRTFAKGQAAPAVVRYSDGGVEAPARYAYVIVDYHTSPQEMELRDLATGGLLVPLFAPTVANHPGAGNVPFTQWIVGGNGHKNAYTGDDSQCGGANCHGNLDSHPAQFGSITPGNGWCFRCHYGKHGTGPVDSSR